METETDFLPGVLRFDRILRDEIATINQRRRFLGREVVSRLNGNNRKVIDTVGLALSGGGVRSAAFSLGVLQALNHHDVLRNVDYLSTVSGGGYVGSSLTANMTCTEGQFPFGSAPKKDTDPATTEISDTAAVGHLRNYSNYLIPTGGRDLLTGIAIIIRGLVANFAMVLPVVLLLAAGTILTNPSRTDLRCPDLLGYPLCEYFFLNQNFRMTLLLTLIGIVCFFLWALYRSFVAPDRASEFRTALPVIGSTFLILIAAMFFLELQAFFIEGMFDLKDAMQAKGDSPLDWLTGSLTSLAVILTPLAALVTFFHQQLGDILKAAHAGSRVSTKVVAVLGKVAFWVAGAAVPVLVWVAYLYLSYWGIINDKASPHSAEALIETTVQPQLSKADPNFCIKSAPTDEDFDRPEGAHTPRWMIKSSAWITYSVFCPIFKSALSRWWVTEHLFDRILLRPMVLFYCSMGFLVLILSRLLKPNANSLHRLYRDRLSKAFLFDSRSVDKAASVERNEPSIDQGRDFPQLDRLLISELSGRFAPYHLINAALNIQGSDYANRRGRNADFFLFSPRYVGSEATGYASTALFEKTERSLDLATAMAISGAAASSNMGSNSIRPLRPTLALLNVRLGYWLKNPRYVGPDKLTTSNSSLRRRLNDLQKGLSTFLWSEITGRLYENSNDVYLTDGGHIENLGLYELLKRRCKLIIVVDAEADFAMHFPSFVTLQRYARIDINVLIEMPWNKIQETTSAVMGSHAGISAPPAEPSKGPHAAIGDIDYGGGEHGFILYIKASLTGDENDYVRDYARRYQLFPHESTGDQFFSEEQFEVYRALGFHATNGVLCDRDGLEVFGTDRLLTLNQSENEAVRAVRSILRPVSIVGCHGYLRSSRQ
jgi:hypothetical protein